MIKVTIPAVDRGILTIEQLRAAAGVTDSSQDEVLDELGVALSDWLASICGIAKDGIHPPTFKVETVEQTDFTVKMKSHIVLDRLPIISVTDVTSNGETVDPDTYVIDHGAGLLIRVRGNGLYFWSCGKTVITYNAGFDPVPTFISTLLMDMVRFKWDAASADARVKRKEIVDISVTDYWVGPIGVSNNTLTGYPADIEAKIMMLQQQWIK